MERERKEKKRESLVLLTSDLSTSTSTLKTKNKNRPDPRRLGRRPLLLQARHRPHRAHGRGQRRRPRLGRGRGPAVDPGRLGRHPRPRARRRGGRVHPDGVAQPRGPTEDFGIKYNCDNGGPAPESLTDAIYERTKTIDRYFVSDKETFGEIDLSKPSSHDVYVDLPEELGLGGHGGFKLQVIDPVEDYLKLLKTIYDFREKRGGRFSSF